MRHQKCYCIHDVNFNYIDKYKIYVWASNYIVRIFNFWRIYHIEVQACCTFVFYHLRPAFYLIY